MPRRTLVTGFLPFGGFQVNPSALLAESCGRPFELIEVAYAAADEFLDRLGDADESFDRLVMLGLRGNGTTIDLERLARNHIGEVPDVRGVVRGPAPVEPGAPDTLFTTLAAPAPIPTVSFSSDPGCYLCNYVYYRALRRFPGKRVGFVHVPPLEVLPPQVQQAVLAGLLDALEAS